MKYQVRVFLPPEQMIDTEYGRLSYEDALKKDLPRQNKGSNYKHFIKRVDGRVAMFRR